jgi:hypothetical protein
MDYPQTIMNYADQIKAAAINRANAETWRGSGPLIGIFFPDPNYPDGVDSYYADIPDCFRPLSELPDPAAFDPAIETLKTAMDCIRTATGAPDPYDKTNHSAAPAHTEIAKLSGEGSLMPNWNGQAALAFKSNFLGPFPTYTDNQFGLIATLKAALQAHQAMWQGARDDAERIARIHLRVLTAGSEQTAWVITFAVLAAVASVVSAGTADLVAVGWAALGSTASVAGTFTPLASDDSQQYNGANAKEIIAAMKSSIADLKQRIGIAQGDFSSYLAQNIETVIQSKNKDKYFEAPRPALTDGGDTGVGDPN